MEGGKEGRRERAKVNVFSERTKITGRSVYDHPGRSSRKVIQDKVSFERHRRKTKRKPEWKFQ